MKDREILDRYNALAKIKKEDGIRFLDAYIQDAGDDVSAEILSFAGNVVLLWTDELDKGMEYFRRAMEKEPENPDIYWSYFTNLEEITDQYPKAIDDAVLCLTKLIEISSKVDPAQASDDGNGKRYRYTGDSFDREESIAYRYSDLAAIYMKIPDYGKAEACIDKTLQIFPDDEDAREMKKQIAAASKQHRGIFSFMKKIFK